MTKNRKIIRVSREETYVGKSVKIIRHSLYYWNTFLIVDFPSSVIYYFLISILILCASDFRKNAYILLNRRSHNNYFIDFDESDIGSSCSFSWQMLAQLFLLVSILTR